MKKPAEAGFLFCNAG